MMDSDRQVLRCQARLEKMGSVVSQNLTLLEMPPPVSSCLEGNLGQVPVLGEAMENRGAGEGKAHYVAISY